MREVVSDLALWGGLQNIFKAFVQDFLGLELEIDKVETEKPSSLAIGLVDSRFDLFAEDKKIG